MMVEDQAHGTDEPVNSAEENQPVRRVLVFMIIGLGLIMTSVDATIVATALHSLQHELRASINWVGWTITAYSLGFVLMLPVSGKLSERYGCRKIFLGSVIIFTVASLACGLADNIYALIALRAVQAAGGAGFTPSATGIIVQHFGDERDRAVGLFGSIFSVGAMIGPIFGGLFVSYWTWRGIFFVNVPIGVAVTLLALRYVPHDRLTATGIQTKTDAVGMALLGIGLFAAMLAAGYLGETNADVGSPTFIAPSAIAIATLWMFFRHINHSAHPFIAPRLIHGPGFGVVNLVNGLYGGVTSGVVALVPLYATNRYGFNALNSATLLIAEGVAAVALSVVAALILRRTGYRLPLYIGSAVIAVGMLLLALSPAAGLSPYAWLSISAFLIGAGGGAINPASRNAGLQLEPERSSTLAALRSMFMQIGTIAIVTIATAILASSRNQGVTQAWVFVVAAALLIAALPIIARVPEHHGSW
ncbi:MAG: MFS transporter [Nitrosospira sp.]